MKLKSLYLYLPLFVTVLLLVASSCKTHRDCKGRKKTAKTAMGGWL
jgi:hypothetical protein